MAKWQLTTPVAFLIFNRPDTTSKVFEEIRRARPPKLLVVADGPRIDRPGEAQKCQAARATIDTVDWPCEVLTNYSDVHLGCKVRPSSGLDWVFEQVEEAIILEDDCLPHPSFFRFGEELLEYYRDDQRIMVVSGNNFQFGHNSTKYSYYFSRYSHIWGWASWRRAWEYFDVNMKLWLEVRDGNWLRNFLRVKRAYEYWSKMFEETHNGEIDAWDFQWIFTCWIQNGLSILPCVNLVSNIGFGSNATHTKEINQFASMLTSAMDFPLKHPPFVIRNIEADDYTQNTMFTPIPSVTTRLKNKLYSIKKRFFHL